ncbi:PP2C family protein-serine/threonine phosphatase [Streptomyces corynorhini]|uniref:Phosphatase n=1 Tax=Streptomyces corynorhini TaxID=2282652 RepID=A0A370BCR4_9ACTN|nr:SpoIIE family protein phosphatase [Streptomyces corynorhini]RDG38452.1 phosphatase [Streptomyces corynorhini]
MPSPLFADRPAPQPTERGTVEALIDMTRRLRGDMDAVRRDASTDGDDTLWRWQRALCDLAVQQLNELSGHLDQLRTGRPAGIPADGTADDGAPGGAEACRRTADEAAVGGVGSAEWNLLTDEVRWSDELYRILGRAPESGPLPLDELPSLVFAEDEALFTTMVTDCLIDGRPMDGELRLVRADGQLRTVRLTGEPVLDTDGCTASMWAVVRDVSALRRGERALRESRESLRRERRTAGAEERLAAELREAVLPSAHDSLRLARGGAVALDLAARPLSSPSDPLSGGDWYDTLELPNGEALLSVGDLTGQGVSAASCLAMVLGAVRGMAMAGVGPGALLAHLNQLLETSRRPALGSALCGRYDPVSGTFSWAQAGHPAPLLFRGGTGRALTPPDGVLLGATTGAAYEQAEVQLLPGDLLVLHTDGLTRTAGADGAGTGTERDRLLALAPRLAGSRDARECATVIAEEFGQAERAVDGCVMVARIG